jgi:hypothetical protein
MVRFQQTPALENVFICYFITIYLQYKLRKGVQSETYNTQIKY